MYFFFLQVNLYNLLNKFNGVTEKEYKTYKENFMKRFEIRELPPYLILYIKVCNNCKLYKLFLTSNRFFFFFSFQRFTKNTFFVEKNPTIINFSVK